MSQVMIVDDEKDIRRLVEITLDKEGIEVLKAENGEKALEILDDESPDLILLDINMPGLDGWETLREMEKKGFTRDSPVIMFTIEDLTFVKMLREDVEGLVGYIEKPFEREELTNLVEEYVNKTKEIKDVREKIEKSPNGDESLGEAYEAWSRSILIHKRFLEKLETMEKESDNEEKLTRIENMKTGEENTIEHLKQKKEEIIRSVGLET